MSTETQAPAPAASPAAEPAKPAAPAPAADPAAPAAVPDPNAPAPAAVEAKPAGEADWDRRVNSLANEGKKVRAEREALKAEKAAVDEAQAIKALAKGNPLEALSKLGIDTDDLLLRIASGGAVEAPADSPEIAAVKAEIEALRREKEAEKAALVQQANERKWAEFCGKIETHIKTKGDEFEAINSLGLHGDVIALMEGFFAETKQPLSVDDAAALIEQKAIEMGRRYVALKKISAGHRPAEAPAEKQQPAGQRTNGQTLSSNLTAAAQSGDGPVFLSRDESIKRAVSAARSQSS